jgi:hypothetical protein
MRPPWAVDPQLPQGNDWVLASTPNERAFELPKLVTGAQKWVRALHGQGGKGARRWLRDVPPKYGQTKTLAAALAATAATLSGQADIIDGDTIKVGSIPVRLYGIDAPEGGKTYGCGKQAHQGLSRPHRETVSPV